MFERDRCEPVVGRMPASGVVEVRDPGGDLDPGLGAGGEMLLVDELDLERAVERLGGGVVERAADPAHRLGDAVPAARVRGLTPVYSDPRSVWKMAPSTSPPRVVTAICKDATTRAASWCADMAWAEHPAREQVLGGRQVQRPLGGVDLRHISAPQHIRCHGREVA